METGKLNGRVCPVCGSEDIYIGKGTATITDKDNNVLTQFEARTCTCDECGAPIYCEEVDRFNRLADAQAKRELHPYLLTLTEIRGLPIRYAIPRKWFKAVMGIPSKHTYHDDPVPFRIFDGELPTYEEEERLRAIHDDPKHYVEFLKLAEGKIPREVFDKSMEKALSLVEKG